MRRDELYLVAMIEAAAAATTLVRDVDETGFGASDLIQSAVLQKLLVIGEAAGRVSPEIRAHAGRTCHGGPSQVSATSPCTHTSMSTGPSCGASPPPSCASSTSN
ncbi:hypothetical protein FAIPA1_130086 [Frankia sp. AiPs1]